MENVYNFIFIKYDVLTKSDLIETMLETIIEDLLKNMFENIDYKKQMIVVDTINEAVKSIQEKTSEIALIFPSK